MSELQVSGLVKRFGAVHALRGVDLVVPAHSRTAVVGPSGSGKSTLLRLLAGFDEPDSGLITLGGEVLAGPKGSLPAHRRGVGIVAQDGALFPHLDVAANIAFGLERGSDRQARVAAMLDTVQLDRALATRRPHQLSGGQQQRVALARALARRPRFMVLDEPFSALDPGLRQSVREVVSRALEIEGVPSILVTHDQTEAMAYADQVAIIRDGRIVQAGPPRELYLHPTDPETALFLGEAVILPARLHDGFAECALGRIGVDDRSRSGLTEIMIRPEQLDVSASPEGRGVVIACDFQGSISRLTLETVGEEGPLRMTIRRQAYDLPAEGSIVGIEVRGRAHVFP